MLVNENNANIFSVLSESIECGFDGSCVRLSVDNEEVLLSIGTCSHMLLYRVSMCIEEAQ